MNVYDLQSIRLKQYNKNSQRLIITITENNQPYFVDKDLLSCAFKMITPDDRAIYNECTINDNGTITVDITESCCIKAGRGEAELDLFTGDYQLCTMNFHIIIEKSVYENSKVIASPEFDVLTMTIAENKKLNAYITECENARNDAEITRKDNELSRIDAENIRIDNEILRIDAEKARDISESIRSQSEEARKNAESIRIDSENIRICNENERIASETSRVSAESEREKIISNALQELDRLKSSVTEAVQNAQDAAKNAADAADACKNISLSVNEEGVLYLNI